MRRSLVVLVDGWSVTWTTLLRNKATFLGIYKTFASISFCLFFFFLLLSIGNIKCASKACMGCYNVTLIICLGNIYRSRLLLFLNSCFYNIRLVMKSRARLILLLYPLSDYTCNVHLPLMYICLSDEINSSKKKRR